MMTSISSPFQAPAAPGMVCVILDASLDPALQEQIEQRMGHGLERCVPLFDTTPYVGLQSAGPFAVLCALNGALLAYASALLERVDAGCVFYLKNEQHLDPAVEHWRSLLTVSSEDTPARLVRFYDPRWLEPLLRSLNDAERAQFMGPLTDMAWRNELGWRHLSLPRPEAEVHRLKPGWLHLSVERQRLMQQHRLHLFAVRLARDYHTVLSIPEPEAFVYRQLIAARQTGYLQLADLERWLRLALRKGDGFWRRAPFSELLAREALSLGDKLNALERL